MAVHLSTSELQFIESLMFDSLKKNLIADQEKGRRSYPFDEKQLSEAHRQIELLITEARRMGGVSIMLDQLKTIKNPFQPEPLF